MKRYYFYLLAQNKDEGIEVRRVVSVRGTTVDHAELIVLDDNQLIWNRDGWELNMIQISKQHAETIAEDLEIDAVFA